MVVTCEKCGRTYNDTDRWTICPHRGLGYPATFDADGTERSTPAPVSATEAQHVERPAAEDGPAVHRFGRDLRALIERHHNEPAMDDRMTVAEIVGVLESTKWNVLMMAHIQCNMQAEERRRREADQEGH